MERSPEAPFTIVWSYQTAGQLEPCGCSAQQLGGLAKRATRISAIREREPVLAIEGASIFDGTGSFQMFKGEILVSALNAMQYDVLMLGVEEAQHGSSGLFALKDKADFPLVCANLVVNGKPWDARYVSTEVAGNPVTITGVSQINGGGDFPAGIGFISPEQALDEVLDILDDKAGIVIACLEGDTDWIDELVGKYQDRVDLFLTGDKSCDAHELALQAAAEGSVSTAYFELPNLDFAPNPPRLNNWGLGHYLGQIEVRPQGNAYAFSGQNIAIDELIKESPSIRDIIDSDYKPRLTEFFGNLAGELAEDYLAPRLCGGCHIWEYEVYSSAAHFDSLNSLQTRGYLYNPDCVVCHVVYDQDHDEFKALNCISCHQKITWSHEWEALAGTPTVAPDPGLGYTFEFCATCHDEANSLPFADYWPQYVNRIYHGGDMSAAIQAAEKMGLDISEQPPDLSKAAVGLHGDDTQ